MSQILYYSNYCENSKNLLQKISKSHVKNDMHFICIDKRVQKNNGATFIILENSQEIILPPTVNRVPALLLLNKSHHVLFGDDIYKHLQPIENNINNVATKYDGEPSAFCLSSGLCGVASDNYSFLDQNSESLSAKGDGGMRQLYNYATINHEDNITTPPDTYEADTIGNTLGNISMEDLQQKRMAEIQ